MYLPVVLALALAVLVSGTAQAASFALLDGKRQAVIATRPSPTPAESFAASELARYVKAMSGVDLKVVAAADPPSGAVVVSRETMDTSLGDEGYSIAVRDGRLYLTGARDRSVTYAVYDLLERLGCRWLAPEFDHYKGRGEFVPKVRRIVLDLPSDVIEGPRFKLRKLYVEEGLSHNETNLLQMVEWMAKSRFNTLVVPTNYQGHGRVRWDNWREKLIPELRKRGIQIEVGGHGYQNFLNADMENGKLFDEHPEWFGMDREGRRSKSRSSVFCTSNPAAVEYLTKNVIHYLKTHPEIDIFDFWPPDGASWCSCPECNKLGPAADRQSMLVKHVRDEVRKQGLKTRLECIAYSMYTSPPKNPPMDQSVLIDFCPIDQCFEVQIFDNSSRQNGRYTEELIAWRKAFGGDVSIYSYYRKYAWRSLPVIIPHYMQADLRWYAGIGAAGISSYAEPGDWQTYELNHYTLARLAWDPDADVDKIISDFCAARYGKSAGPAIVAYFALEQVVRNACSIPGTSLKSADVLTGYIDELKGVEAKLPKDGLRLSIDYALRDLAIRKNIADDGSVSERAKMVDDLVSFMEKHKDDGVFIIHGRLDKARLGKLYQLPEETVGG